MSGRVKFSRNQISKKSGKYNSKNDEDFDLDDILRKDSNSKKIGSKRGRNDNNEDVDDDDEMSTLSFGALSTAQKKIYEMDKKKSQSKLKKKQDTRQKSKRQETPEDSESEDNNGSDSDSDSDADSDSESDSEDSGSDIGGEDVFFQETKSSKLKNDKRKGKEENKKRHKHAPTETSSKRRVGVVREIPGLLEGNLKYSKKYKDIRFDATYGKINEGEIRKNYKFLDDYRNDEINQISSVLKDKKITSNLTNYQIDELDYQLKSTKSKLDSLKNKDLERKIVKDYKAETGKEFIKRGDKRKLIQIAKFENMKGQQREKAMERKRKRRLGKEFKQFDFNNRK
ncbi:hypothetical protein B5S30_g544 [[Candida] boidinii]|nr:hypothetical protein B5S30_g544 [[Candida] boidinii]